MTAVATSVLGFCLPRALHFSSMPELPEVETIRRALEPLLLGERLTHIEVRDPRIVQGDAAQLHREAVGSTLVGVMRRGKHLVLLLDSGKGLALHLRMTGSLLLNEPRHSARTRAVLCFSNGTRLYFNDMRRLGTIRLIDDVEAYCRRLGPEPLAEDFTPDVLRRCLAGHRIPIKAALLDQHLVAGVGNMYADEALFLSKIHPMTPASSLSHRQTAALWRALREVLQKAIANQGASINTYALPDGERGTAHERFNVAHRKDRPCPSCGTPLQRLMVRKRGAYFCPECQPPATPEA
jgi:formamidopyrimidine-DNA glycosylase